MEPVIFMAEEVLITHGSRAAEVYFLTIQRCCRVEQTSCALVQLLHDHASEQSDSLERLRRQDFIWLQREPHLQSTPEPRGTTSGARRQKCNAGG